MRNILSISVLAVATAAFASADPVLFDDFNYPIGPLDGQNGGTGWAGAWNGIPQYSVASGSLSYCDATGCLQQSGNRAQFIPSNLAGTNSLRTISSLGSNGSTFWLSFLISFDGTLAQNTARYSNRRYEWGSLCWERAGRSGQLERGGFRHRQTRTLSLPFRSYRDKPSLS